MSIKIAGIMLAVGLVWANTAAADPIIYSQSWIGTSKVQASQNDTSGQFNDFATVYDDFMFGAAQRVTDVHWTGLFFSGSGTPSIPTFTISFYADSAGQPGSSIYSAAVAATQTSLGVTNGELIFTYDADLPTAFQADAGTRYWLSIVANFPLYPQWGIAFGAGGNGLAYQDFFGVRNVVTRDNVPLDIAFSLSGSAAAVPEPGSLALAALGLFGLVARGRKAKR